MISYSFAKRQLNNNGRYLKLLQRIAKAMHFEKKGIWVKVQDLIDKL